MEDRMPVRAAVEVLARRRRGQVVVSTMTAMHPWWRVAETDRDLPCAGFMGGASTFGLGVQLARPDVPVWVLDGDGSLAMQLGSLLTIANARPRRFLHVVFHNGVYDVSGGQRLIAEGLLSFTGLALSAGYARAECFRSAEAFDAALDELLEVDGPVLVELISEPIGDAPTTERRTVLRAIRHRLRRLESQVRAAVSARGRPEEGRPAESELAAMWPRVRRSLSRGS